MAYTELTGSTALSDQLQTVVNENFRTARFANKASKTTAFTAASDDAAGSPKDSYYCDATAAGFTVTLPAASAALAGRRFFFIKTDATANVVTLDGNAAETINGAATYALSAQYQRAVIECTGTAWLIVST